MLEQQVWGTLVEPGDGREDPRESKGMGDVAQSQKGWTRPGGKRRPSPKAATEPRGTSTQTWRSPGRDRLGPRQVGRPGPRGAAARSLG